jgi:hypothetical protein
MRISLVSMELRQELINLRSQFVISSSGEDEIKSMFGSTYGGRRYSPLAFTEHGALMAANVLRSDRATQMSVFVVRAFIKMREMLTAQHQLAKKLANFEKKLTERLDTHETAIIKIIQELILLLNPPPQPEPEKKEIGFQVKEKRAIYGRKKALKWKR